MAKLDAYVCEHNCLKFIADLVSSAVGKDRFDKRIPSSHLTKHLFEIKHDPALQVVLNIINMLPRPISSVVFWALKTAAGQYRNFKIRNIDIFKSISMANDSGFAKTGKVYLPSQFVASQPNMN